MLLIYHQSVSSKISIRCHRSSYHLLHGKSQSIIGMHNWQEELKRKVIKESRDLHRLKGTPAAIKKALEPFGYEVTLVEWFKAEPEFSTRYF